MFLMFEDESSDESDDSENAEDGTDLDCKSRLIQHIFQQSPMFEWVGYISVKYVAVMFFYSTIMFMSKAA